MKPGDLFILTETELQIYRDDRHFSATIAFLVQNDIIMYLGPGRHLDVSFLSKRGIVGWNGPEGWRTGESKNSVMRYFEAL